MSRLALVDPMNLADVARHEDELLEILDQNPETDRPMAYEAVVNEHDVAVAVVLATGLGDGLYPLEARFEQAGGTTRIAEIRVRSCPIRGSATSCHEAASLHRLSSSRSRSASRSQL